MRLKWKWMWKTAVSITPRKLDETTRKEESQNKEPALSFGRERAGSLYVASDGFCITPDKSFCVIYSERHGSFPALLWRQSNAYASDADV